MVLRLTSPVRAIIVTALVTIATAGCAQQASVVSGNEDRVEKVAQAVLLVSMSDGSIVQQTVPVDADFCMKSIAAPETTCFKAGPAIYDTDGVIVGHRMIRSEVNLYAAGSTSL